MSEIQTADKPLSAQAVEALSRSLGEPEWLLKWRLKAWRAGEKLQLPGSRYTQVRGLDLDLISPALPADKAPEVRPHLRPLIELGEAAGRWVQLDGQLILAEPSQKLLEKGVIFMDITRAVAEHPKLVRDHLEGLEGPKDKIEALRRALFLGGPFIYVPEGVRITGPIKAVQILTSPGIGLFTQGLLIAERGSSLSYIEELYSPVEEFGRPALQAGGMLVELGPQAQVDFAGVQDWHPKVFSFIRRLGRLGREARLSWTFGWLGGRLTISQVESLLDGTGAQVEDVQVFFTEGRQQLDLTSNLIHKGPHTRGEVNVKGVLRGRSRAAFWGLIRVEPEAKGANAFQSERSLILEDGARSNAIPSLEIETDDVRCTHAASASQIDEEQLFYLRSRGLREEEAKKVVVEGFFEPLIEKIPLPAVRVRLRGLIDRKWHQVV